MPSPDRISAPARRAQRARLAAEVRTLLDRLLAAPTRPGVSRADLAEERAWWSDEDRPLVEAVRRSFLVRQLALRAADSAGSWRASVSYIGDADPADQRVCGYDYDRAELRLPAGSAWARPYPWTDEQVPAQAWYSRTGMAAITAWALAVARIAAVVGPVRVVTNRLYHETAVLFRSMDLSRVAFTVCQDIEGIVHNSTDSTTPVVVFLDSSRPFGDAAAVGRVLSATTPDQVPLVVWDNTCASTAQPPAGEPDRPLLLIRSHVKLDQYGLEFSPLGSLALIAGQQDWARRLRALIPECLMVTGGCASPTALRLLDALGLPDHDWADAANPLLRAANGVGARVLAEGLAGPFRVVTNDHSCFVEVHVLDIPGPADPGSSAPWPPWDAFDVRLTELERRAQARDLPVWKSASFGFHYTGLSWYGSDDPGEEPHTVLRVCFGMHDPEVAAAVARTVVEVVAEGSAP
ncbi:hypothetical protein ACOBQX_03325 [Actinokineospora sp. G85]|uniref:hypothetical protein n=1 Tax=Actinokineospora sp. G85 TaxID=3406626 RepID=UPI003C728402